MLMQQAGELHAAGSTTSFDEIAEQRDPYADWSTAKAFATLGQPEHVGHAFAITRHGVKEEGGVSALLKAHQPDYEHRVYVDPLTDNLIVVRPDAKDGYGDSATLSYMQGERLR